MGFEIRGVNPKGPRGDGSSLNPKSWSSYLRLLELTNVFQPDEIKALQHNDGFIVSETKALEAASKLRKMDCYRYGAEFKFKDSEEVTILHELDVQELVAFLETCGGFAVW